MLTMLMVAALVANGLALLYAFAIPGREGWRQGGTLLSTRGGRWLATVILSAFLLPFLITLPTRTPFSHGLALGWGILAGGLAGFLVCVAAAGGTAAGRTPAGAGGPLGAAGLVMALVLQLFHRDPAPALLGCALGAMATALAGSGLAGLLLQSPSPGSDTISRISRSLLLFGIAAVVVSAAMQLAVLRYTGFSYTPDAAYRFFPALMLGAGALATIAFSAIPVPTLLARFPWIPGTAAAVIMLAVACALRVHALPLVSWKALLTGLLAFALTQALLVHDEHGTKAPARPLMLTFGMVLAVLVVIGAAFRWQQGVGEATALLPAVVIAGTLYLRAPGDRETPGSALGMAGVTLFLLFLLSRLVLHAGDAAAPLNFQRQYDLFALVLGTATTIGVMSVLQRLRSGAAWPAVQFVLLAILVAAIPPGLLLVLGIKSFTAFLAGLAVGEMLWMVLVAWTTGEERPVMLARAPHGFLITAILVAIPVAPLLLAATLSLRQRMGIVAAFCGIAVIWAVVDGIARWKEDRGGIDHARL